MPLQQTFWAERFGMLTDKFGVNWMSNFEKPGFETQSEAIRPEEHVLTTK